MRRIECCTVAYNRSRGKEQQRVNAALQALLADIADAGYRTVAFHHLGGLLVGWASRDGEDEVLRAALANLRERQLEQQFAALVGSADHAVYIYSRCSEQAVRGLVEGSFGWVNLINGPWLLQVVEDPQAAPVSPERQHAANDHMREAFDALQAIVTG